ncbi:hypothetical protein [Paenibacillus sp. P22]|uniref:hypothetical protein n=1 Tax=Paenibacillus sp. P22 TaxID=483908 RepID=UPI00038F323F|nr:hypothetical protein [Paenibacillus sp. P22]CDN42082.1 hypothetical protein BN871_AT_00840 [Paenibacillus sp. P22]
MLIGLSTGMAFMRGRKKRIVTDNFSRADSNSSLGKAETGQSWVLQSFIAGVKSGAAYLVSGTGRALVDSGVADNFAIESQFKKVPTDASVQRIIFRYVDSSNEMFFGKITATTYGVIRRSGGSLTTIASYAQTPADGDRVRIEVRGSNIRILLNGVQIIQVTDPANITGTQVGLFFSTGCEFEYFVMEAL